MVQPYYIRQGLPNQNSHKIYVTTGSYFRHASLSSVLKSYQCSSHYRGAWFRRFGLCPVGFEWCFCFPSTWAEFTTSAQAVVCPPKRRLGFDRYRRAAEVAKVRGRLPCLMINDLDAGVGIQENVQRTVRCLNLLTAPALSLQCASAWAIARCALCNQPRQFAAMLRSHAARGPRNIWHVLCYCNCVPSGCSVLHLVLATHHK